MIDYTPRTWVDGALVDATEMNTEIRDGFKGMQAAWTAYSPSWYVAGISNALNGATLDGQYTRWGKTVFCYIQFTWGLHTNASSGPWSFDLPPAAAHDTNVAVGHCFALHGATHKAGAVSIEGTALHCFIDGAEPGIVTPWTWGGGDFLSLFAIYEAA